VTSPVDLTAPVVAPLANSAWRQLKWGLIRLASPVVLLALWQLGSALGVIPQDVLPAPSLILGAEQLVGSEQEMADLFAESEQIAAAPEFARWVDRRYTDALQPLYLDRD
jgi:hypothetical protein